MRVKILESLHLVIFAPNCQNMNHQRRIITNFKLQGLSLRGDAASLLVKHVSSCKDEKDVDKTVDKILDALRQQNLKNSLIDKTAIAAAIAECTESNETENPLTVIDAFSVPRYLYNAERKKFIPGSKDLPLFGTSKDKTAVFRERYDILLQRTMRHKFFSPPAPGVDPSITTPNKFKLKTVEHVLSSAITGDKLVVLAMLAQIKEGRWYLEDPTGIVEVNVTETIFQKGLFVETSFVLAEGIYDGEFFIVSGIGFPPAECSADTRSYFGNINFFGSPAVQVCAKSSEKMAMLERKHSNASIVFLSDVFLDDPQVMEYLNILFSGYSEAPPTAFIFMGNFSAAPYGAERNENFKQSFVSLAEMIQLFPEIIEQSQFVFVPGPLDPGLGNILPRPPIPGCLTKYFREHVPNSIFTSNPCHLQFCTQEIVVFREDIISKLSRACIRVPRADVSMAEHLAKTLISQAHLCPLPLHSRPRYWTYDHALRLYPLPDLIVIGDKYDSYAVNDQQCTVTNPGSFSRSGYEFKVYLPGTKQLEDSKIANNSMAMQT